MIELRMIKMHGLEYSDDVTYLKVAYRFDWDVKEWVLNMRYIGLEREFCR